MSLTSVEAALADGRLERMDLSSETLEGSLKKLSIQIKTSKEDKPVAVAAMAGEEAA